MNRKGHRASLVAAQPGNENAVSHGVFSERRWQPLVADHIQSLTTTFAPSQIHVVHVEECARLIAQIQLLDDYIERAPPARRLESALALRLKLSESLRKWLEPLERAASCRPPALEGEASDWIATIQAFARGEVPGQTSRERLVAAQCLVGLGRRGGTEFVRAEDERRHASKATPRLERRDGRWSEVTQPPGRQTAAKHRKRAAK